MGDTLQHTLVNPNQLRAYGTTIQDNPFSPLPLSFDPTNGPVIPLTAMGTIIYCTTRTPSDHELSSPPHIILSSSSTWDPHNVVFPSNCVEGGEQNTHISSIPPLHTISLPQFTTPRLSIQDWFRQSKYMLCPNPLKNCPPWKHFKAKVDTLQSLLKIRVNDG